MLITVWSIAREVFKATITDFAVKHSVSLLDKVLAFFGKKRKSKKKHKKKIGF